MNKKKDIINITEVAKARIFDLLSSARSKQSVDNSSNNKPDLAYCGIRITVKSGGCSGLSYDMQYAYRPYGDSSETKSNIQKNDEIINVDSETSIYIDMKAAFLIIGTTLDYKTDKTSSKFVFVNPNASAVCGCGESFAV